jgi:hypothetical protein
VKDKVAWKRKRGRKSEGKKGRKKKAGRHIWQEEYCVGWKQHFRSDL